MWIFSPEAATREETLTDLFTSRECNGKANEERAH